MLNRTHQPRTHQPGKPRRMGALVVCLALGVVMLTGCDNMHNQGKLETYGQSIPFGQAYREPRPEAVPSGYLRDNTALYQGTQDGQFVTEFPIALNEQVLAEGQRTFNDFCAPCHGYGGYGDGPVSLQGFPKAASYHTDELRAQPVGYLFQVITNGKNAMYPFASKIPPEDRWAVVAYIRALQASQSTPFESLPPDLQNKVLGR